MKRIILLATIGLVVISGLLLTDHQSAVKLLDSGDYSQTVVTPYLKRPMEAGQNLLYCSSFQLAWDALKNDLLHGDIHLAANQSFADALNQTQLTPQHLTETDYLALSGFLTEEFVNQLQTEFQAKFTGDDLPQFNLQDADLVSYAYLAKNIRFPEIFDQIDAGLAFPGGDQGSKVKAFGFRKMEGNLQMREQVLLLDFVSEDDFIVESKTTSETDRLILAKVEPGATLAETYQMVEDRISKDWYTPTPHLRANDTFIVPEINFGLKHSYPELVGNQILGQLSPIRITQAEQWIKFDLDEQGASLKAESRIDGTLSANRYFEFDRPFLLYIKEKDAKYPYLAIWLANRELMVSKR